MLDAGISLRQAPVHSHASGIAVLAPRGNDSGHRFLFAERQTGSVFSKKENNLMKYVLLVYADVSKQPKYTPEQLQAARQIYSAYVTQAQGAGVLKQNEGFHPVTNPTTVRVRDDKTATADAPVANTPEQLTGYIMLDCKNLDEAINWAAKNPAAGYGSIEVRPVDAYSQ